MASFFYLGGAGGSREDNKQAHHKEDQNQTLYLYRNEPEIYANKLEIWPQYYPQNTVSTALSTDFGVGPSRRNFIYSDETTRSSPSMMMMSGSRQGGGINCQDCGNQAKKDCPHLRCRTCCKSRGFQCQTHVNSTWVPAAKRRERQQTLASLQQQQQQLQLHQPKRMRENHDVSSSLACTRFPSTSSGLEVGQFPPEVNSPAVFRCVKVSAMDDEDEEYAYQTAVNIGGHVFKGLLYDQGPDQNRYTTSASGGEASNQNLNLITAPPTTATTTTTAAAAAPSNNNTGGFDPSLYPAPLNAFITGTQFFPNPRS